LHESDHPARVRAAGPRDRTFAWRTRTLRRHRGPAGGLSTKVHQTGPRPECLAAQPCPIGARGVGLCRRAARRVGCRGAHLVDDKKRPLVARQQRADEIGHRQRRGSAGGRPPTRSQALARPWRLLNNPRGGVRWSAGLDILGHIRRYEWAPNTTCPRRPSDTRRRNRGRARQLPHQSEPPSKSLDETLAAVLQQPIARIDIPETQKYLH
jgi:hypothetical protein